MRNESLISWTILFVLIGGFLFWFPKEIRTTAYELVQKFAPCSVPISYKIGTIDPKFGISKQILVDDLEKATSLWNEAHHSDLFVYDAVNGVVEVNLAYDSRQEMTTRLKSLGLTVTNDRSSYEEVKAKYDSVFAQYSNKKVQFQSQVNAFNLAKASYEKDVAYWNGRGGAPRSEYAKLQATQSSLEQQSKSLQTAQDELNNLVGEVNDLATALNRLIDILKLDVQKYNETGSSHGASFEQGVFERAAGRETITIFEYENNALLTRVLAHEFGHALGLEHVEDGDAIMYYLNQGSSLALTSSDTEALDAQCKSGVLNRWHF